LLHAGENESPIPDGPLAEDAVGISEHISFNHLFR